MALSTCVISGTLTDLSGAPQQNVNVYAYCNVPLFYGDGTMLAPFELVTTTSNTGAWSVTLVETTSIARSITIAFDLPTGSVQRQRKEYFLTVPNTATASFASLVTGQ